MSIRQLYLLSALALTLPVVAQPVAPGPVVLSLPQALEAAKNNIDVSMARRALAGAQGDVVAADHSPIPVLSTKISSIDLQNGIGGGNVLTQKRLDKSVGLDWTLERGDKRGQRTRVAQRSLQAAQADLEDVQTQQQLTTHAAFFDLLAAQERAEQVLQMERSATQLAALARRRVQAGDLAAQEASRTEIESQRAAADTQSALLDQQRAALALAQLTGRRDLALRAAAPWPATEAMDKVADLENMVDRRADVRAARERVEAALAAREGAMAQKKADITLGTSLDHFPGTSTQLLEVRMQMPLQWNYNYQGEIARAEAQLDLARDMLDKIRRQALNEMQRLQQELASAAVRSSRYDNDILPKARQVADNAELAYSKGALSLSDLLDARRTLRSTLIEALAARTDYAKALGAWQIRTHS